MGLFGKMFEKKFCSVCGEEIKFLGNRKLEDGNLCKSCAGKLSPWFSDRRKSTVDEIRAQLAYREENKAAVDAFHITRSLGTETRILLDEDAGKFMVTRARDIREANPDVLDISQLLECQVNIDDGRTEEYTKDSEGKNVSYNPPRYTFYYDFEIVLRVNHPYFDTIRFQLNPSRVEINEDHPVPMARKPQPRISQEFRQYETMALEIKEVLDSAWAKARQEAQDAAAPKAAVTCPWCGATTVPDESGCCEYCGGSVKG